MSRVVVVVDGEATLRAAHSLAVHPGVDEVCLLAPAKNANFPIVDSPVGFDLVIGTESASVAGNRHDIPVAVTVDLPDQAGVGLGSPVGLALALAVGVDRIDTVAVALPGEPDGEVEVVFPSPIDSRRATVEKVDGHDVHLALGPGPLAAAMVLGNDLHRVIVDDHAFMAGIALAAAAAVALAGPPLANPMPVWTRAADYLRVVTEMGLVIGERAAV